MGKWVKELLKISETSKALSQINPTQFSHLNIHEIWKYVDDVFTASETIPKGCKWSFVNKTLIWSQDQFNEDQRESDARTMEEMSNIASSIFKCLNFTWDCPSRNKNNKMPVLDTEL